MGLKKLTLSVPEEVIEQAKQQAARRGTSVSAMFTRLLKTVAAPDKPDAQSLGPVTRRTTGIVALPPATSDRELLEEALGDRCGSAP